MAHDVLARIVEVISGMKYGEYLRKNIFDPLGMEKACHHPSEEEMKNCAKTYKLGENGELVPGNKEHFFRTGSAFEGGGTGLTCSVDEYAKFTKALTHLGLGETGNRILSSRTVNLIRTNRLTGSLLDEFQRSTAARSEYGYGLGVRTMLDRTKKGALSPFGEFGWDGALSTHMSADPENKVSLVFGVQTNGSDKTPPFKMIFRNMIYAALEYEGYIGAER